MDAAEMSITAKFPPESRTIFLFPRESRDICFRPHGNPATLAFISRYYRGSRGFLGFPVIQSPRGAGGTRGWTILQWRPQLASLIGR